jgi:uncharacterized membrane protein YdjX (TVP38/TMEM64 family)
MGDGHEVDSKRARPLLRFVPVIVLALAIVAVFATGAHSSLLDELIRRRDELQASVAAHQAQALALYFVLYVVLVSLMFVPGAVFLTVFGGFLFGWVLGGLVTIVAATLGAIIVFLIARTAVGDILVRKAGPRLGRIACGFREDAFAYLMFLRLFPGFPFWLVNLAPALFGVPLRTFALATAIGIIPGTFAFAFIGVGLDSVIAAQKAAKYACLAAGRTDCSLKIDFWALVTPELLIAFAALAVVSLAPVVVRRLFGHRLRRFDAQGQAPYRGSS